MFLIVMLVKPMNKNSIDTTVDVAVVVVSSDGYSDFWPIFFLSWKKFSPFAELPIYLLTATKSFSSEDVQVINTPNLVEASWSERIKAGLSLVEHKYVLMLTEDLLCIDYAEARFAQRVFEFINIKQPTCLRLIPSPPSQGERLSEDIFSIPSWAMHRVSLQASVWNREKLLELFEPGDSAAAFEVSATKRCRSDLAFYCINSRKFPLLEVIGYGQITRKGVRVIKRMGLESHIKRDVFTVRNECIREWKHLKSSFFYMLPSIVQRWLLSSGIVGAAFR